MTSAAIAVLAIAYGVILCRLFRGAWTGAPLHLRAAICIAATAGVRGPLSFSVDPNADPVHEDPKSASRLRPRSMPRMASLVLQERTVSSRAN